MFKCTDCGQEYEIKPDYCECGNNVFEEILSPPPPPPKTSSRSTAVRDVERTRAVVDLPSLLIFLTCIILSILSLIFIGRDNGKKEDAAVAERKQEILLEIPSIDKLWIEKKSVPVVETPLPVPSPVVSAPVKKKVVPVPAKSPALVKQSASVPSTPVSSVQKPEKTQTVSKSMTEKQKEEIIKKLTTPKKVEKKPEPSKPASQVKVEQTTKPVVQPEPQKQVVVVKPDPAQLRRELAAYKIALRNKIASNINFAGIIGDGSCAVTFKLDSSGNLVERKFSVQSDNNSVNDVVYAAMMQNPSFNAPPEGYKNETLTLSVKMYGGNFAVTLK